jgi:hypothetical protein
MLRLRHACTLLTTMAIACGTWALSAAPAGATGASTIAAAGPLPQNALVVGGGQPVEFFRVALSAGDQLDLSYDMLNEPNCGYLYLFDPTVTDFNLEQANAVSSSNVRPGEQAVALTSSFNGVGTLAVSIDGPNYFGPGSLASTRYPPLGAPESSCDVVTPFSLTATIEHLTQASFLQLPSRLDRPSQRVRLQARIQSPAGTPEGECMFERLKGSPPVRVAEAPVHNGTCGATVRAGQRGSVTFRVTFTGNGWQTSQATSRKIVVR